MSSNGKNRGHHFLFLPKNMVIEVLMVAFEVRQPGCGPRRLWVFG